MSNPYIGEIRMFAGNYAPEGWLFCDGAQLAIAENDALFNLIGTTYGGDGQSTFNLPDLRGRVPVHQGGASSGTNYPLGMLAGAEQVTVSTPQLPVHTHVVNVSSAGTSQSPAGAILASAANTQNTIMRVYSNNAPDTNLVSSTITSTGGGQPHANIQPSIGINFIISLFGIYPSQQ